ncbi:MAG: helix-turn-helix transcriptional regulator [Bdellovibrionota bacterium]
MESFASRLKRLRVEKGLSAKDIAQKIGVSVSTYREWEYGRQIKGEPYVRIATALEVTLYKLLTGKDSDPIQLHSNLEKIEENIKELRKNLQSFF